MAMKQRHPTLQPLPVWTPPISPRRSHDPAGRGADGLSRRAFGGGLLATLAAAWLLPGCGEAALDRPGVRIPEVLPDEDLFAYVTRLRGGFDRALYQQVIGAANEHKEGDEILGVAAADDVTRENARLLLGRTRVGALQQKPLFEDALYARLLTDVNAAAAAQAAAMTLGELRRFLLDRPEAEIKALMGGLASDTIACVVKLMTNQDLIAVSQKVFNPLPGSQIGAKGYMGARVQPNSPTDHPDDVVWQVFSAWAFAVGDVVLGTNPVSSDPASVAALEAALLSLRQVFQIEDVIPHCVLAHIDVQAEVELKAPGTTGLWFQSLAGSVDANATFDVSLEKMLAHAARREGRYGLYFETGQGADFTNGHGKGTDMVVHEARKYGFARLLKGQVAEAQRRAGRPAQPWVHVNDVAGFIGPEVFRTREQLVRCCLEDLVMGKLHGIMIGLDVCSTLHMDVSLDDLDWCLDQIMPANPGYLMGLPTKNDPMLGYLTTAYQDHVRIRERFGFKVNDAMWTFFKGLGVIDAGGQPTVRFGDPLWVYLQFRRRQGDVRPEGDIFAEGRQKMAEVRARGVWLAEGYGKGPSALEPKLEAEIRALYEDSKKSIWAELSPAFVSGLPQATALRSRSADRSDYILHPASGEALDDDALAALRGLRERHGERYDLQILVSDGLNAYAISDPGHLLPYLEALREGLSKKGYQVAPELLLLRGGRVRAGYRVGELLFAGLPTASAHRGIIHVIGERPGSMHHTFSVYMTAPSVTLWSEPGKIDHNITKVVSGVADTALAPALAAQDSIKLLEQLIAKNP